MRPTISLERRHLTEMTISLLFQNSCTRCPCLRLKDSFDILSKSRLIVLEYWCKDAHSRCIEPRGYMGLFYMACDKSWCYSLIVSDVTRWMPGTMGAIKNHAPRHPWHSEIRSSKTLQTMATQCDRHYCHEKRIMRAHGLARADLHLGSLFLDCFSIK
jgi:hypothetical protein